MNKRHRLMTASVVGIGLLIACGGSDRTATGPNGITVSGVVRDAMDEPIGGATVFIPGKGPVTTASDGRFSFAGVAVPYNIAVFVSSQNTGTVYKSLTRSDPSLTASLMASPNPQYTATITGTVPPTSGKVTWVFFAGPYVGGATKADAATGQYSITVQWYSSATARSGRLFVLQWSPDGTGWPLTFDGYASRPLAITAGGTLSGNDFAASDLSDPPEQSIAGSVAVPAGYALNERAVLVFVEDEIIGWFEQGTISTDFTRTVPAIPGATFGVQAFAQAPTGAWADFVKSGIAGNATGVVVPLDSASRLASPADGAAAVDTATPFTWSEGGGSGVSLWAAIPDDATNPTFFVFTEAAGAKIPDFTGAGVALPAGAGYHWHVERIFPLASIDDAAGPGFLPLVDAERGDVGETVSESFGFTTAAPAGAAPAKVAASRTAAAVGAPLPRLLRGKGIVAGPR